MTLDAILLRPGRRLRDVDGELTTALSSDDPGSPYDRLAATYDRVVGNALYNRLAWGAATRSYTAFAIGAVTGGQGALLDVGCGSAVFTAAGYRDAKRPLVLVDHSRGMLARAARRLDGHGADVAFVQADLFDLPFVPGQFPTVVCHGVLHLFDDIGGVLRALSEQVAAGGSLHVTSLVAETAIGSRYLTRLHRAGMVAAPRRELDVLIAARAALPGPVRFRREGSMLFLTGRT